MDYIPDNITDCLFSAKMEIEKARLLTDYSLQDYPFDVQPEAWALMHDYKRLAV